MIGFVHPAPFLLSSARLTLTDLVVADFASTYVMDMNDQVMRYIGGAETRSFDDYQAFIKQRLSLWIGERFHMWAMRLHGSEDFLGWVMIKPIRDTPHVEVGYRMLPSSWGKGYATEATRAVLAYGFNVAGFDEITGVTHPDNAESQHVLTKAGLTRDGTLNYSGGGEIPFFRLTKQDYEKRNGSET